MLRVEPARQALPYGGRVERLPGEDQRLLVVAERRAVVLTASLALRRAVVRVPELPTGPSASALPATPRVSAAAKPSAIRNPPASSGDRVLAEVLRRRTLWGDLPATVGAVQVHGVAGAGVGRRGLLTTGEPLEVVDLQAVFGEKLPADVGCLQLRGLQQLITLGWPCGLGSRLGGLGHIGSPFARWAVADGNDAAQCPRPPMGSGQGLPDPDSSRR